MTTLERLVQAQVATSTAATLARTTDRIADELTQELLRDPTFRAEFMGIIRRAFTGNLTGLTARPRRNGSSRRRRTRKARRA